MGAGDPLASTPVQQAELSPSSLASTFYSRSPCSLRLWVATVSSSLSLLEFPSYSPLLPTLSSLPALKQAHISPALILTQTSHPEVQLHGTAVFMSGFLSKPWDWTLEEDIWASGEGAGELSWDHFEGKSQCRKRRNNESKPKWASCLSQGARPYATLQ